MLWNSFGRIEASHLFIWFTQTKLRKRTRSVFLLATSLLCNLKNALFCINFLYIKQLVKSVKLVGGLRWFSGGFEMLFSVICNNPVE